MRTELLALIVCSASALQLPTAAALGRRAAITGPPLWAYHDPPIVKYARAGSQAIFEPVLALLEAGAEVVHAA